MPRVALILEREETERRVALSVPPLPEDVKLYLPSECSASRALQAEVGCPQRLIKQETALRRGQCSDALTRIRSRLCAKRYLVNYRNAHVRGQRATGRSAALIESIGTKIKDAVDKYRRSWASLVRLAGVDGCGAFRELRDSDVKVYVTAEADAEAVKKLGRLHERDSRITGTGRLGGKAAKQAKRRDVPGETRATMSWIWTADGGPDVEEDGYLHECTQFSVWRISVY